MNKKVLVIPALALMLTLAGASAASAHGMFGGGFGKFSNATPEEIADHQQVMFQEKADLLGISVDEFKNYWAEGKDVREIADELGITDEELRTKMQAAHQQSMQEHMQVLVDQGVITQAQADARLQHMQDMQNNMGNGEGQGPFAGRHGGHHGFGF